MSLSGSSSAATSAVSSSVAVSATWPRAEARQAVLRPGISSGIGTARAQFELRQAIGLHDPQVGTLGFGLRWRAARFSSDFGSISEISKEMESEVGAVGDDVRAPSRGLAGCAGRAAGAAGFAAGCAAFGGATGGGGAAGGRGGAGARVWGAAGRCAAGGARGTRWCAGERGTGASGCAGAAGRGGGPGRLASYFARRVARAAALQGRRTGAAGGRLAGTTADA